MCGYSIKCNQLSLFCYWHQLTTLTKVFILEQINCNLQWFNVVLKALNNIFATPNILFDIVGYILLTSLLTDAYVDCVEYWIPVWTNRSKNELLDVILC